MREKKHAHTGCNCKNVATNLTMRWRSSFGHGTGSWAVALKKTATTAQQVTSHSSRTTSPAYLSPRLSSFGCVRGCGWIPSSAQPLRRRKRACASSQRPCPCSQKQITIPLDLFHGYSSCLLKVCFDICHLPRRPQFQPACRAGSMAQMSDAMRFGRCVPEPT